jgi:hypothetical protein
LAAAYDRGTLAGKMSPLEPDDSVHALPEPIRGGPNARLAAAALGARLAAAALALLGSAAIARGDGARSIADDPAKPAQASENEKKTAPEPKEISPAEIKSAVQRCVAILLERQESLDEKAARAEWPYEGVYRVGGQIPIGYRIGGTSIAATALLEACGEKPPPEVRAAVERALEFVLDKLGDPLMAPDFETGYDVRGWGHAFALDFLLALRARESVPEKNKEAVAESIRALVDRLQKGEIQRNGGWNYARGPQAENARAATFMTAPTIQILFEAARQGEKVDGAVLERALSTLEGARLGTGSFQYGSNPEHKSGQGIEAVPGAIARMSVCETTLYLAGRGSIDRIRGALDAFFAHWGELEKRRKKNGTHEGPYKIAPYFFYYGHRYAAQAIEMLPEAERAGYRQKLYGLLWRVREEDAGWNDRVFPRSESFGTSMALLALLEPGMPRPARWTAK